MTKQVAGKVPKQPMVTLLVPMLASNWALCLATGFIGGKPRPDCGLDAQALYPGGIAGSVGKLAPWLLAHGEPGDRVVLKLSLPVTAVRDMQGFSVAAGLHRVTLVKECQVPSEGAKAAFEATFNPFPDVPARLVPLVAKKFPALKGPSLGLGSEPVDDGGLEGSREAIDAVAGWVAGLIANFECHGLVGPRLSLAGYASDGIAGLATAALASLAPGSTRIDIEIWKAVVREKVAPSAARIGDRHGIIAAVGEQLAGSLGASPEANAWLSKVSDVVSAKCDLPPLGDDGSIGKRAALALVLGDTSGRLPMGARVSALVSLATNASMGFSRLPASGLKDNRDRLDALLGLAGRIVAREVPVLELVPRGIDADFSFSADLCADGKVLASRKVLPPPWLQGVREAARASELEAVPGPAPGVVVIMPGESIPHAAIIERQDGPTGPCLRVSVALCAVKPKAPALPAMRAVLEAAWESGLTVGIRSGPAGQELCLFGSVPLDPMTQGGAITAAQDLAAAAARFGDLLV